MNRQLNIVFPMVLLLLVCACSTNHRVDGWYHVSDHPYNSIVGKPLATVREFEDVVMVRNTLVLDGDTLSQLVIEGVVKPQYRKKWADGTERLIGKRLGFVYKDSVITAPQVNVRIESGSFGINSPDTILLKNIYNSIKQNIK